LWAIIQPLKKEKVMTAEDYLGNGVWALDDKEYEEAFQHFQNAANMGHSRGYFYLGMCYDEGFGIPKNRAKAIEYFKKSAAMGDENAKNVLQQLGIPIPSPSTPTPSARSGGSLFDLTETKWIQGKGKPFANIYKFMANGIIKDGGKSGKWSQNGNSVTFTFGSEMSISTTELKIVSSNTMKGKMKIEYLQNFSSSGKNFKKGDIEFRDWDLERM
jgi:tetratricopeptide (TPR) repeat protein